MAAVKPSSPKIDLVKALKDSDQAVFAPLLVEEFARGRITHLEHVKNAPLKVKITYGADIYKVMKIITEYYEKPQKAATQVTQVKKSS